jgi:hypothetical protein
MDVVTAADALDAGVEVENEHFMGWWRYWGELLRAKDDCGQSRIYGFESVSDESRTRAEIPDLGATYGFVTEGEAVVLDDEARFEVKAGQWFNMAGGCDVVLRAGSRVVASQRVDYRGLRAMGGPVERLGRLRYIDGCSDSLLVCPPVKGDPCFNHLHFPTDISQTEHYHPSTRSGTVAEGGGWCETPYGMTPLVPGMAFYIPAGGLHRFVTTKTTLDVIAYHPDSDWGPTDSDHPMVNRTWVDGRKIDNSSGVHATAQIEDRWLRATQVW